MKSIHTHYHSDTEICISNSINPKVLYIQTSYITWKVSHTLDSKSLFIFLQLIFNKKILLKNEKRKEDDNNNNDIKQVFALKHNDPKHVSFPSCLIWDGSYNCHCYQGGYRCQMQNPTNPTNLLHSWPCYVCHNKCFCLMMVHPSTIQGSSSASCTLYPCFMSVPYQGSNTILTSPTWKAQKEQNKHYIRTWEVKNKTKKSNKLCNE